MAQPFFDRFRTETARYADGVHRLGEPAPAAAVAGLPTELASFLRSWDGADLFVDAYTLYDHTGLRHQDQLLVFGEMAGGDSLALDLAAGEDPPVVRLEADTGEVLVEATSFQRWLEGVMAAEAVVYDREGEFRENVFTETGEELTTEAAIRRERKILKVDPGAPGPAWRLARALHASGQAEEAAGLLAKVTAAAPRFGWARYDLGRIELELGRLEAAEEAFASAAEADPGYEHAGWFAAHAARAAARRGDEPARSRHAARALSLDPDVARSQRDAARGRLEADEPEAARDLLELAAAVTPRDLEVIELRHRLP